MAPRIPVAGFEPRIAINVDLSITRLHNCATLASKRGSNAVRSKLSILTGLIEQPRTPMPRTVSFTLLTRCATRRHLFQPGLIIERLGKRGEGSTRGRDWQSLANLRERLSPNSDSEGEFGLNSRHVSGINYGRGSIVPRSNRAEILLDYPLVILVRTVFEPRIRTKKTHINTKGLLSAII